MPAALEYLAAPEKHPIAPVTALFGDEPFLQRECLAKIRASVLTGEDAEFSCCHFNGEKESGRELELRTVLDELNTVALFGGGERLVIIDRADEFISRYREELEKYAAKPSRSGKLVFVVKTWPSNTRLAKSVAATGLSIECKTPSEEQLLRWLGKRAEQAHAAKLAPDAAELLIEIIGPEMGHLDQELEKLALIARTTLPNPNTTGGTTAPSPAPSQTAAKTGPITIHRALVESAVGGWRAKSVWELSDRLNAGDAAAALLQLRRLVDAGEEPIAILAMISSSLRKYAAATRIADLAQAENRRVDMKTILTEAGMKIWPAAVQAAEQHLKQLTRARGRQILGWLLDADLALKGRNSSGHRARMVLEELIVRLSKQAGAMGEAKPQLAGA